jgi:hypothetical protein
MDDAILANIKIDGGFEQLYIIHITENVFLIEETSVFNPELQLGVKVELKLTETGDYEFVRIVEKSKYVMHDWILSKQFVNSKEFEELKTVILNFNGTWEQIMNGIFIAHLPENNYEKFIIELQRFKVLTKKPNKWESFLDYLKSKIKLGQRQEKTH